MPAHATSGEAERPALTRRLALVLLVLPTLLLGPGMLRGERFLPHLPVLLEPLAAEQPQAAAEARGRVLYGPADRIFPTLSDQLVAREELGRADLPTWEPNLGLGVPLFANSIAGLAYPPNWLGLALPPDRAAGPLAWLTLVLAGLGMALFLGRLGLCEGAVAVGILALQGGGWGLSNLMYFMKVDAALWLPWSLWAVEGLVRGLRGSALALFLAVALSMLAGFPPIALFGALAAGLYGLVRLTDLGSGLLGLQGVESGAVEGPILAARLVFVLVLGIAGGAWQLLPMAESMDGSMRGVKTRQTLTDQSLAPATLAGVAVPDFAGPPGVPNPSTGPPVAWWLTAPEDRARAEHASPLEWNTFAGVAQVLLGLIALATAWRRALVPTLGLVLVYGFAQAWPGFDRLYGVPGLGIGAPGRVLSVAWILWPWLAALGAEALITGRRGARWGLAGLALAAAAGGAWFARGTAPAAWAEALQADLIERYASLLDRPEALVREYVPLDAAREAGANLVRGAWIAAGSALALGLTAAAVGLLRRGRHAGPFALALGALLVVEAAVTSRPHLVHQAPGDVPIFPDSAALEAIREAAGDGRVLRLDQSASGVGDVERLARPNLLQVYGVADLTPWTVFTPRGLVELVTDLDPGALYRGSGIARLSNRAFLDQPLYDLLRVTCILSMSPIDHPRLTPVLEREAFYVYRREGALPPARVVGRGLPAVGEGISLGLVTSRPTETARSQAVLAPGVEARPPVEGAEQATIEGIGRPARNRLDLRVRGSRGGLLVMHEQFFPGWKATIDGEDAEILRVDHVYRGLWLPEGDLVVRTWYEPRSLRLGFGLTLTSLGLALFLVSRRGW